MPFLTEVHFQNYRSFLDAKCRLSPVTVVIGANNAGKSNFLRGVGESVGTEYDSKSGWGNVFHRNAKHRHASIQFVPPQTGVSGGIMKSRRTWNETKGANQEGRINVGGSGLFSGSLELYKLVLSVIGLDEPIAKTPKIQASGAGVTQVLQWLEQHDSAKFAALQSEFRSYIPEVSHIVVQVEPGMNCVVKVQEEGLSSASDMADLSAGTRTILALLSIIFQPSRPYVILLEDIERDIHPRGLKPLVETMRKISKEHGVQIIFTTQSPYVLDAFQDPEHWDAVVIVEKRDGVSTLTNAKERLVALGYEREMDKVPLGDLWYSGLLGGVAGPNELWDEKEPKS